MLNPEKKSCLLRVEPSTLENALNGSNPKLRMSHDRCLLLIGHEMLRQGHRVFIASYIGPLKKQEFFEVRQIYPVWQIDICPPILLPLKEIDFIASIWPEALDVRKVAPKAKIVFVNAALYFVENPISFGPVHLEELKRALYKYIDFIVVQNERMKDLAHIFYGLICGQDFRDRILVSPFYYAAEESTSIYNRELSRQEMGLEANDIAIINAGGVWKWTDFNSFLEEFCHIHREIKQASCLKLFIMGLKQKNALDHQDYLSITHKILEENSDLVREKKIVVFDWEAASQKIPKYLAGSDIGLNINRASVENWQSHRVRVLEYVRAGLAVINTEGDYLSQTALKKAVFLAEEGQQKRYAPLLIEIANNPSLVIEKKRNMQFIQSSFLSVSTTGVLVRTILFGQKMERNLFGPKSSIIVSLRQLFFQFPFGTKLYMYLRKFYAIKFLVRIIRRNR